MKNWLKKDSMSALAKRATDILFMHSPVATAMGVMCGFFLDAIATALNPFWENSKIINLSNVGIYSYVFSGIFICNLAALLFSLFRRRSLPPNLEDNLAFIKLTKEQGNLPEDHVRLMYTKLAEKVLQSVTPDTLVDINPKKRPARRRKPSSD